MKKLRIDLLAVVVLAAGTASAGGVWHFAQCITYADGSGFCNGTFKGFRDDAFEKASAEFNQESDGSRYFSAYLQDYTGNYVSSYCIPNATVSALWPQAMAHNGYFAVSFDANGVCTRLSLSNGSAYYP